MLIGRELRISRKYSKENYYRLKLSLDSSPTIWDRAVDMLRDRINGRYFEPIEKLIDINSVENGFIVMSVLCLLIDTLMQFEHGLANSKEENRNKYISFMHDSLKFNLVKAERFYNDIRNGLLHSAETKSGAYLIPCDFSLCPKGVFEFDVDDDSKAIKFVRINSRDVLAVSVPGMYNVLRDYFERYCNILLHPKDDRSRELRKNFILKMDFITLDNESINDIFQKWAVIFENANNVFSLDGNTFWYEKSYTKSALLIKMHGRNDIEIPFSDINKFLRGQHDVRYLRYIRCITENCRQRALQSAQTRQESIDR